MNSSICAPAARLTYCAQHETETPAWHDGFLALLPAICNQAQHYFRDLKEEAREDAIAEVAASAMIAYHRLYELGKVELAYAAPLAMYGCRQFRDGRRVGVRRNSQDVSSSCCQRRHHFAMVHCEDWRELADDRQSTPGEIAAVRVDFAAWLETLAPRDRRLVKVLASGESTSKAARMFRVTAGRISQLRRELAVKWCQFAERDAAESAVSN